MALKLNSALWIVTYSSGSDAYFHDMDHAILRILAGSGQNKSNGYPIDGFFKIGVFVICIYSIIFYIKFTIIGIYLQKTPILCISLFKS
jgi:hypothetical protein